MTRRIRPIPAWLAREAVLLAAQVPTSEMPRHDAGIKNDCVAWIAGIDVPSFNKPGKVPEPAHDQALILELCWYNDVRDGERRFRQIFMYSMFTRRWDNKLVGYWGGGSDWWDKPDERPDESAGRGHVVVKQRWRIWTAEALEAAEKAVDPYRGDSAAHRVLRQQREFREYEHERIASGRD